MAIVKKIIKTALRKTSSFIPKSIKERLPEGLKQFLRSKYGQRTLIIDIIGSCNLKCPSCPNGNIEKRNPVGMMSLETFKKILEKAAKEQLGDIVALYNWTEPFIHPQIIDFIKVAHFFGFKPYLSTNLNLLPAKLEEFAASNLCGLTISLSGFSQKIYSIGHRNGNIEIVKENMLKLSSALRQAKSSTKVSVYYHKYLYNLGEIELMKNFAVSLGFSFGADWAYFMPIEGVQSYLDCFLPQADVEFIESKLALNIKRAVEATKPFKKEPCLFPNTLLTIDWRGQVQLCCGVYDSQRFSLGSYLEMPLETIKEKLSNHSYCQECAKRGLHVYVSWHGHKIRPVYEAIAEEEIKRKK